MQSAANTGTLCSIHADLCGNFGNAVRHLDYSVLSITEVSPLGVSRLNTRVLSSITMDGVTALLHGVIARNAHTGSQEVFQRQLLGLTAALGGGVFRAF